MKSRSVPAMGVGIWVEEEMIWPSRISRRRFVRMRTEMWSAAADGTLGDRRSERSSTRRRSWWRGKYTCWMDGRKEQENDLNGLV